MLTSPEGPSNPATDETGFPLSHTQESLWLLHQMTQKEVSPYNEPLAYRLTGVLDPAALATALHHVIARHEALRTRFVETPRGLRAVVQDSTPDILEVVDLRERDTGPAQDRAEELIAKSYRRPFDLATGPLLRACLVLLPHAENLLLLTVHHLVTDAWSNALIVDELGKEYVSLVRDGRPAELPPPAVGFSEFARTSRQAYESGAYTEKIARWKDTLDAGPEFLRLHTDCAHPPMQTFHGASVTVTLARDEVTTLLERCRRECDSTDFSTFLAAYAVLLYRYTDQEAFNIATTVLNRHSKERLTAVGCYVNTAVLTLNIEPELTFRELLARAGEATDRLLDDGDVPWPKLLDHLDIERDPSRNPAFQTMLTVLGPRPRPDMGEDITAQPHPVARAAAKFELLLYVSEDNGVFELEAEFNTDLFAPDTVKRLLRHYAQLLRTLSADLDAPVSAVSFVPEDEERLILDTWNDTAADYPWSTVIDTIEEQVRRSPDAVAVEFEGQRLTYDQLNRRANQVARLLRGRQSSDAGPFVGVYMDRSLEMVLALVASMKAGCAYVPIDPDYPADRVAFMIEDAQLSLIFTQEQYRAALDRTGADLLVLSPDDTYPQDDGDLERDLSPDLPVYMIYTSGSTGRPKGTINRHVSLFNRLYWMQSAFTLTGEDRVLQKTPFSFDVSVWEFFWPLMFGARMVLARPGGHRDADYMKRLIHARRVTTVHFVPSILNVFLQEEDLAAYCGSLRQVVCSGEALPYKAVEKFYATLDCELHNLYGPTEAAIDVTHWPCTLDYPGSVVPIGHPIANLRLYVMDREQHLLPIGVPGELCIGGVGVAAGYHGRDELTQKVFIEDPYGVEPGARLYRTGDLARFLPDGEIQYLGRIDNQIKLRGQRVEPEEIVAVLLETPSVRDAAVVLRESATTKVLVGYVVTDAIDQEALRTYLAARLPEVMVPQVLVPIPQIPTTPNGKLDRRALPAPFEETTQSDVTPAFTPQELDVAGVWREVLGRESLDVDTGFFRYGGDSILSITVVAQLREMGYRVEIRDVFAHPTIRRLAAALTRGTSESAVPEVAPFALIDQEDRGHLPGDAEDAWPLTRLQAGMIYHTLLNEGSSVYHDIFDYELTGPFRTDLMGQAVQQVAARHPQLRSIFDLENYRVPLQVVRAQAAVPVGVTDVSHLDNPGQDRAVSAWIEEEKRRPLALDRPLLRFQVHLRATDRMNVALSFHHAILDGWSVALVMEEWRRTYADLFAGQERELPGESLGYGSYVALERQAMERSGSGHFWQELLAGFPGTLIATPQPVPDGAQASPANGTLSPMTVAHDIKDALARQLQARAAQWEVPVKSLYLAAHCVALSRVAGGPRIVSGLVCNGRPEVHGGTELAGLFLNTLPFPVDVGVARWDDLVRDVSALEQRLLPERRCPLTEIQRLTGTDPRFDAVFNYTDFHVYGGDAAREEQGAGTHEAGYAVRITGARYFELTSFPLVVHAHRDQFTGRMGLALRYDAAQVTAEWIERYLQACLSALSSLASGSAAVPGSGDHRASTLAEVASERVRSGELSDAAPDAELERQIAEIVRQAIDAPELEVEQNYLERGVDSITAIRILAQVRRLSPGVGMGDVIGLRTVRALTRRAEEVAGTQGSGESAPLRPFELAGSDAGPFPPDVVDAYPMTALQLDMVRATDRDRDQAAYHDLFGYHLALPLDERILREALRASVNQCETLRTSFALDARPRPLQLLHDAAQIELTVCDDDPDGTGFKDWFSRERGTGFDWSRPALMRFTAHRHGERRFTLAISFHHSVIDGWSLSLFVRDLVHRYAAALSGEDAPLSSMPAVRYRDYVREELASRDSREARDYWRAVLDGHPGTRLPRFAPSAPGRRWAETRIVLEPSRQTAVRALAAELGVAARHVLLACHLRAVGLLCRTPDVVTGVFTHGRPGSQGGDQVLGMFLNFLPHRARVGQLSWAEFVHEVFGTDRDIFAYRQYPLAEIREDLEQDHIFPTLFNYTEFGAYADLSGDGSGSAEDEDRGAAAGGHLTDVTWFEHTHVPLLVNAGYDVRQERMTITFNADAAMVPPVALESVARLHDTVLTRLLADSHAPVSHINEDLDLSLKAVTQHIVSDGAPNVLEQHG